MGHLQMIHIITSPGKWSIVKGGKNNRNALQNEHLSRVVSGGSWKVKQVALS